MQTQQQQEKQEQSQVQPRADRQAYIDSLHLPHLAADQLNELLATLPEGAVSHHLISVLASGLTRDQAVEQADADGYLRGKNEHIEAVAHVPPADAEAVPAVPPFPVYRRRSVWDD